MTPVIAFLLFYIFALYIITKKEKLQKAILIIALIVIAYLIGSRKRWPDEMVYQVAFNRAPYLWDFNFSVSPFGYAEKGYLLICSIINGFFERFGFLSVFHESLVVKNRTIHKG